MVGLLARKPDFHVCKQQNSIGTVCSALFICFLESTIIPLATSKISIFCCTKVKSITVEPLLHKRQEHHCGATVAQRLKASLWSHCCTKVKSIIVEPLLHKRQEHHCGATVAQRLKASLWSHCCTKVKSIIVEPLLHKG